MAGETDNKNATSFATVLADGRWAKEIMNKDTQQLDVEWVNHDLKDKHPQASRMLIVTLPEGPQGQTMMYFNLVCPNTDQEAKRLLGKYFCPLRRAHPEESCGQHSPV